MIRWLSRSAAVLVFAGALLVSGPSPAGAGAIVVDTLVDDTAADGLTSLREAVVLAGATPGADEIVLDGSATYLLTDCAAGALVVAGGDDLTIVGNGATITQTCPDERIIDKTGPNTAVLTVEGVILEPGPLTPGGDLDGAAIRATSQLIVDTITITGADAGFSGSLLQIDFGPADHDIIVTNSTITGNTGTAIDNQNPAGAKLENSTVSDNTGSGIGISDGSPIDVTGSSITGNGGIGIVTSGQGFGIQPVVTITDSTIAGNDGGGFFCLSSCRTLVVAGSTIIDNGAAPAPGRGGGMTMPIVLDGAVNPTVTISDSIVSGNTADHPGAGLSVYGTFDSAGPVQPEITVTGTVFSGNETVCAGCDGGAIAVTVGNLSVIDSTITDNIATGDGGGVAHGRGVIADVDAPATLSVVLSDISGNRAAGDGGGLSSQVDGTVVDRSTISGNEAGGFGGGVSAGGVFNSEIVVAGDTSVVNSTIATNVAGSGGGVRVSFPDGSAVTVENSTVVANLATTSGGGFFVGPTELLSLDHVTVTGNRSPGAANIASNGPTAIGRSVVALPLEGLNCGPVDPPAPIMPVNLNSDGFNWFDDASCQPVVADVVAPGVDPQLGELADNGGPSVTRLPDPTSPVGGIVPAGQCTAATDQRGVGRPSGLGCEAGSVEITEALPLPPDGFPASRGPDGSLVLDGTPMSEEIVIELAGGTGIAVVRYDADRTDPSNVVETAAFTGPFADLTGDLRGGDDRLEVREIELTGKVDLDLGTGSDEALLVNTAVAGDVRLVAGSGGDRLWLFDLDLGADLAFSLGFGDDAVTFAGGAVAGRTTLLGSRGNDRVTLAELDLRGPTSFIAGRGDDELRVFLSTTDRVRFVGSGGDDSVGLADTTVGGPSWFVGGGGRDSYSATGTTAFAVRPTVVGFP